MLLLRNGVTNKYRPPRRIVFTARNGDGWKPDDPFPEVNNLRKVLVTDHRKISRIVFPKTTQYSPQLSIAESSSVQCEYRGIARRMDLKVFTKIPCVFRLVRDSSYFSGRPYPDPCLERSSKFHALGTCFYCLFRLQYANCEPQKIG